MLRVYRLLNGTLNKSEEIFIAITLLAIAIVVFVNVVMRYGFAASTMWTEELTRYTIIWITFVGGSVCARENYHPKIEALVVRIPANMRWTITLTIAITAVLFSAAMTIYGWQLVSSAFTTGHVTPTGLAPMFIPLIGLPLGGALMTIRYCQVAYGVFRKRSVERENADK